MNSLGTNLFKPFPKLMSTKLALLKKTFLSGVLLCSACVSFSQNRFLDSLITRDFLYQNISALAHDSMEGRKTGTPGEIKAANFIIGKFREIGLYPIDSTNGYKSYFSVRDREGEIVNGRNLVGMLPGNKGSDSIVLITAHYDHIGKIQDTEDIDSIYNGANDNASGVAGMLALAKYYKAAGIKRHTMLFIAFSGEEMGLFGALYMSKLLRKLPVKAIFNLDMVGVPMKKMPDKCMVICLEKCKVPIQKMNNVLGKKFFVRDMFPSENLAMRSDSYEFSFVPINIFFSTTDPANKYYHTVDDETETIHFDFYLQTIKNIAVGITPFL